MCSTSERVVEEGGPGPSSSSGQATCSNSQTTSKMADISHYIEPLPATKSLFLFISRSWKTIVAILIPLGLFPVLVVHDEPEVRCACVVFLMAAYWMLEPIHISATALLPVALFPMLDLVSTSDISITYMKSANMMFFGGLLMAIAIESSGLHKRVALKVLLTIGTSVKRIQLGIMLTTMFLSMWISNTATTAMMVPIVDFMLNELDDGNQQRDKTESESDQVFELQQPHQTKGRSASISSSFPPASTAGRSRSNSVKTASTTAAASRFSSSVPIEIVAAQEVLEKERDHERRKQLVRRSLFLGVAYAANIGGTGTLTGTGTNLVLTGLMEEMYPESHELTFASWFAYSAPSMLFCVLLSWVYLHLVYVRKNDTSTASQQQSVRRLIQDKYSQLGPVTFHEQAVMSCFVTLVALWFLRDPQFIPGWSNLMGVEDKVKDATPAILIAILMFIIPANWEQFTNSQSGIASGEKIKTVLDWPTVQRRMPWGVIILLGGGFAMAEGTNRSGLSKWLGEEISHLNIASPRTALVILVISSTMITEIASNVATASVVLPVINQLALAMGANPLLLMLPVTIAVSFAFMFPVATPPNAIVYEKLNIRTWDMVKPGIVMEIICVSVQLVMINTLGVWMFNLDEFPDWALPHNGTARAANLTLTSLH